MSLKKISFGFFLLSLVQSGSAFGDSFIDLGLNWTQWLPKRGSVQKYQSEDRQAVITVPQPQRSWRTLSAEFGRNVPQNNTPAANPVINETPQNVVVNQVMPVQPVVSVPEPVYQPMVEPTYSAPVVTQPVSAPVVTQPVVDTTPAQFSASSFTGTRYDALIRMDGGPFPSSSNLVSGQPQAWYLSPVVQGVYGGMPSGDQQKAFEQDVIQKVQQTYAQSGVNIQLTTDPNAGASRTISVVSGASFGQNGDAAGIAEINGSGFSFIDKMDNVHNVNDLQWALARNVAHELMHSFGVEHHDTTGDYLDSAVASWNMLLDPNTKFSQAAVSDLLAKISSPTGANDQPDAYGFLDQKIAGDTDSSNYQAQLLSPQPVPEPATIIVWSMLGVAAIVAQKHRRRGISA
ncbi:MAG: hypothetical protein ACKO85_17155 [Isosphaeraceae bacterium]